MAYQNPSGQSAADKNRQRSEIQRNIAILGSDIGKGKIKKAQLEAEIRKFKKEAERAEIELQKKQQELQKVEQEIDQLNKSVKDFQKKQNEL